MSKGILLILTQAFDKLPLAPMEAVQVDSLTVASTVFSFINEPLYTTRSTSLELGNLMMNWFCPIGLAVQRLTRVNSTNVLDEGLRIGEVGRQMNSKVKLVKQGVYQN
jgi:hypothetical protein